MTDWLDDFGDSLTLALDSTRDFVGEGGSAGDLLPIGQPIKPVPREAKVFGPHAFRGKDVESCSVCGQPATAKIHRVKKTKTVRGAIPHRQSDLVLDNSLRHAGPEGHVHVPTGHVGKSSSRLRTSRKIAFAAKADDMEPKFQDAMSKLFAQQKAATLSRLTGKRGKQMVRAAKITRRVPPSVPAPPPVVLPIFDSTAVDGIIPNVAAIFDVNFWMTKTAETTAPLYQALGAAGVSTVHDHLGDVADQITSNEASLAAVEEILKGRANLLAGQVTQTTFDQIQETLAEGVANGESTQLLADRVSKVFDQADASRAQMIARTEVASSMNQASNAYASQLSPQVVGQHEWLSHHDQRTRPTHLAADGQKAPIGQPYHVGASLLAFPGDPAGPPNEVIQCRCSEAYLPAVKELGEPDLHPNP